MGDSCRVKLQRKRQTFLCLGDSPRLKDYFSGGQYEGKDAAPHKYEIHLEPDYPVARRLPFDDNI